MNKITLVIAELIIASGLIYTILNFWKRRMQKPYGIESTNKAYGLFLATQIITLLLIVWLAIDPQSLVYMEDLQPTGAGSGLFWTFYGFQIIGFLITYLLSAIMARLIFRYAFQSGKDLNKEISEDNWGPGLIVGCMTIFFGVIVSGFLLRSVVWEWISGNAGFVPLQ